MGKTFSIKSLAFSLVTFIAGAIIATLAQDAIKDHILISEAATLGVLVICMVALGLMINAATRSLEKVTKDLSFWTSSLDERIGLNVRYIESQKGQAILFRELRKVVEQAEKTIIMVNTFLPERNFPEADEESMKQRRLYYDSIIKRIEEGVRYERLIQVESEEVLQHILTDYEYLRHFHKVLDLKEAKRSRAGLIKAPPVRPLTFALIDDRWLVLQMNERYESGRIHMHGMFIIEDPQQTISRYFKDFYHTISLGPLGSIRRADLPPLPTDPDQTALSSASNPIAPADA